MATTKVRVVRRAGLPPDGTRISSIGVVTRPGRIGTQTHKPVSQSDDALYEKPLEELKEETAAHFKTKLERDTGPQVANEITIFLERHPEYWRYDNTPTGVANGKAIKAELDSPEGQTIMRKAGRVVPDFSDMELAFERCKQKGTVKLHQGEIEKQQLEQVRQRVSGVDNDPETMAMHRLRALANGGRIDHDPLGPQY